jgi:hypothetical protein
VQCVWIRLQVKVIYEYILRFIQEKNLSNVQCAPNCFYGQVNWKVTWEPTVTNWWWGKLFLLLVLHIILLYILGSPLSTILYIYVQEYPCKGRTWYRVS